MDPDKLFDAKIEQISLIITNTKAEIKQLSSSMEDTKTKIVEPFMGAAFLDKIEVDEVWKDCNSEEFKSRYLEHEIKVIRDLAIMAHSIYMLGLKVNELEDKKKELENDKHLNHLLPCELFHEISLLQQSNSELQQGVSELQHRNGELQQQVEELQQQVEELSLVYVETELIYEKPFENGIADYLCSKLKRNYPTKDMRDMAVARLLTSPNRKSADNVPYTCTTIIDNSIIRLNMTTHEYLQVTHYCMSQTNACPHFPRHWELQGATDESNWVTLRRHDSDTTFSSSNLVGAWEVEPLTEELNEQYPYGFCYFRIIQHGTNVSGNSYLCVEKLDMYGSLRVFRI